jgi:hypothetical protein
MFAQPGLRAIFGNVKLTSRGAIMTTLSVRGLEPDALSMLKSRASAENASVNTVVLRMIRQGLGQDVKPKPCQRFSDLDALAGSWSAEEAASFDAAVAPFGDIDPALWK